MPSRHEPERNRLLVLVVLACLALFALLRWDIRSNDEPTTHTARAPSEADAGTEIPPPGRGPNVAQAQCRPRALQACHAGNVWWFDSCQAPETEAENCEGRGCSDGSCATAEPATQACGELSALGRCDGAIARACVANRLVSVDCGQRGERCVLTREGVACLARNPEHGCTGSERASCAGDHVRLCVDGLWTELDCAARKARCITVDGGPRCVGVNLDANPEPRPPINATGGEVCDGRDNDADRRVDEGACTTVPLVAFVPEGAHLLDLETRMRDELAIVNRVYAPLQFAWDRSVEVASNYRVFDPKDMERTALQLSQVESAAFAARLGTAAPAANGGKPGLTFYIPVLFSEKLKIDPPKAGISTLPNARCGGVRVSDEPSPPHGLIVLSEVRSRETLTHELGHYLGLCHTHEELSQFAIADPARLVCERSGDGICDTPPDPGPNECQTQNACELACRRSDMKPDASNIMSYYLACRRALTTEQIAEADRNLTLRRGWFSCLDPRDCPCEPAIPSACPLEMSCHPAANASAAWSCELDGPSLPGTLCRDASQCALGAICVTPDGAAARCARPCRNNDACSCIDVGLPFRVCAEDLK